MPILGKPPSQSALFPQAGWGFRPAGTVRFVERQVGEAASLAVSVSIRVRA